MSQFPGNLGSEKETKELFFYEIIIQRFLRSLRDFGRHQSAPVATGTDRHKIAPAMSSIKLVSYNVKNHIPNFFINLNGFYS